MARHCVGPNGLIFRPPICNGANKAKAGKTADLSRWKHVATGTRSDPKRATPAVWTVPKIEPCQPGSKPAAAPAPTMVWRNHPYLY